jgi:hypothetical protein
MQLLEESQEAAFISRAELTSNAQKKNWTCPISFPASLGKITHKPELLMSNSGETSGSPE